MNKVVDTIIVSIGIGFLIVGIHQVFTGNWHSNYWILMLSLGMLGWFQLRRMKRNESN